MVYVSSCCQCYKETQKDVYLEKAVKSQNSYSHELLHVLSWNAAFPTPTPQFKDHKTLDLTISSVKWVKTSLFLFFP
jgi:hypothetical protein